MSEPQDILQRGSETYATKNDDYGDSWRQVGEVLRMFGGDTIELETTEDHISYGLYTRRLDKFARAFHGEFVADEMNHEPVVDAHEDEMVYAAMHASLLHGQQEQNDGVLSKIASSFTNSLQNFYDRLTGGNRRSRAKDREADTGEPSHTGGATGVSPETWQVQGYTGEQPGDRDDSDWGT